MNVYKKCHCKNINRINEYKTAEPFYDPWSYNKTTFDEEHNNFFYKLFQIDKKQTTYYKDVSNPFIDQVLKKQYLLNKKIMFKINLAEQDGTRQCRILNAV